MLRRAALVVAVSALVAPAVARAGVPHWQVWLCRPGLAVNYCNTDLSTTVFWSDGSKTVAKINDATSPIDCFYVYPTVSLERRGNADLKIQNEEKTTVIAQAGRFSQVCRVFAPVYRQTTVYRDTGNFHGDGDLAYADVLAAWRDYLANWNDGRGVVLIGHSQGSGMLERLLREQGSSVRKHLVSALLLGGNVVVGADDRYAGVPACRSLSQTGCIVAYSSWGGTPPKDAGMEHVGDASHHILCVNPAAPGGGAGAVTPIFPWFLPEGIVPVPLRPQPSTTWVALPELYTARCVQQGTRSWLLITRIPHADDPRPTVQPIFSPAMGLHAADVNIALGALITLVRTETAAYLAHR